MIKYKIKSALVVKIYPVIEKSMMQLSWNLLFSELVIRLKGKEALHFRQSDDLGTSVQAFIAFSV